MAGLTETDTEKESSPLDKISRFFSTAMGRSRKPKKVMLPKGKEGEEMLEEDERPQGKRLSEYTRAPKMEKDSWAEEESYAIREPYSYARIIYDDDLNEHIYQAIEPTLTEREKELLDLARKTLDKTLAYDWEGMETKDKEEYLRESIESFLSSRGIDLSEKSEKRIIYYINRDYVRYGPIDVIMSDEKIEDVSCDGTDIPLFIFHSKYESIRTLVKFEDANRLNSFIIQLGQRCSKQVSVSTPILDGTTTEGHRVQATYAKEVSTRGSSFTIRRFQEEPFTPVDLIDFNSASPEMVSYMWLMVENEMSMIVAGGTACGKTSTLNAATLFIPPNLKIVSLEDTREINLPHENWIPSTTRTGSGGEGESRGEINMYHLVRNALRQRPDYIIVGEVRGKEAHTMFQAMATGHTTYSTMHADSVESMVHRLENPPINCPRVLLTALDFVIIQGFARIEDEQVRRIKEITELVAFEADSDELVTNTVFEWDRKTDGYVYKGHSFNFDIIQERRNWTQEEMEEEFEDRSEIVEHLIGEGMNHFQEISKMITSYYKEPEETLASIRGEN